jgi:hypothetical protein
MPRFDPLNSTCRVLTRRAGVLSTIGHDLEIDVHSYWIDVDDETLQMRAQFDASSLRVRGAIEHDRVYADKLSPRNREEIDRHIADEVLLCRQYPHIQFASTSVEQVGARYFVRGDLRLREVSRPLQFSAQRESDRMRADVTIHQPDFGIKPFRALGGMLRLHADVQIRISTPALVT